jgi:hypothetical protein
LYLNVMLGIWQLCWVKGCVSFNIMTGKVRGTKVDLYLAHNLALIRACFYMLMVADFTYPKCPLKSPTVSFCSYHGNSCLACRLPFVFADQTKLGQKLVIFVFTCTSVWVNFILTKLTWRVALVEQELLTLPALPS